MDATALEPQRLRRAALAVVLLLGLVSIHALAEELEASALPAGPPESVASEAPLGTSQDPQCEEPESDQTALIDKLHRGVYLSVCGSARWFDGLFGTRRYDQDSDATFGRTGLYELWDDRDGFDTRMRLRARFKLPAMQERLRLLFGREDERELVEDTQPAAGGSLPSSFQKVEDDAWLLGLGYSKQHGLTNGFDFGVGIRIATPVDPYTKSSYRRTFIFTDATALRARQTVFWRDSRGLGETTDFNLDHLLTPQLMVRWDNSATLAEDVRRLEWTSALITFQSLSNRRAFAYTGFIAGVANSDVPIRDYGVEVRYRQRIYRDWLFVEGRTSLTWPKQDPDEDREINPGLGLGFEMYFGPMPKEQMR